MERNGEGGGQAGWSSPGGAELAKLLALLISAAVVLKCTYVVGFDDQLNDILGIFVQNLHCCSRNQSGKVLKKKKKTEEELEC